MTDDCMVFTEDEAYELPVGQWVIDANGTQRCLVDTHVGWPQRMFMSNGGSTYVGVHFVDYPLRLADVIDECPHLWGTQECGHCKRCGALVSEPKNLDWHIIGLGVDGHA
jgi:hypothetical protein